MSSMTKAEANRLLDEHRNGIRIHPVVEVTKALWVTGDLRRVSTDPNPSRKNGLHARMERLRLASSERT